MSLNPVLSESSNFGRSLVFWGNFLKLASFGFRNCCSGTGCKSVFGRQENCIVRFALHVHYY